MEEFTVQESDKFNAEMEAAVFWLYSHNLNSPRILQTKKLLNCSKK